MPKNVGGQPCGGGRSGRGVAKRVDQGEPASRQPPKTAARHGLPRCPSPAEFEFDQSEPTHRHPTYGEPWGGQIPWAKFDQQVLECDFHDGSYAVENALRGARYQQGLTAQNRREQGPIQRRCGDKR